MNFFQTLSLGLLPFALTACSTLGPDYVQPTIEVPDHFVETQDIDTTSTQESTWWKSIHDPVLSQLIEDGLVRNFDVRVAVARLDEVYALRQRVETARRPKGSLEAGSMVILNDNDNIDNYRISSVTGWEIDLWGRINRSREIADADLGSAAAVLHDIQRSVIAQVSYEYYAIRSAQQELDVAKRNMDAQQETVELTQTLSEAGLGNDADVARAKALYLETQSGIPLLNANISEGIHRLTLLTHGDAQSLRENLQPMGSMPELRLSSTIGVPSTLLRNRPDIRAAEHELVAATARIGIAVGELYPRISLTGDFSTSSQELDTLFSSDQFSFRVGPSIRWNFLNRQQVHAQIDAQDAQQQQALVRYEQVVSQAIMEVEIALSALRQQRVYRNDILAVLEQYREAMSLVTIRYNEGIQSFLDVLEAQRSVLAMETALVQADHSLVRSFIAVNTALGIDQGIMNADEGDQS
jgi:NodT family efflux transporter outer membrane factor (OMF) lipoprotein